MTVIFFMESGLGWEVALENGPLRRALLVTDSLVPIPLVAGGSGTYLTGLEMQLSVFRHQLRGRTMLRSRQWRERVEAEVGMVREEEVGRVLKLPRILQSSLARSGS